MARAPDCKVCLCSYRPGHSSSPDSQHFADQRTTPDIRVKPLGQAGPQGPHAFKPRLGQTCRFPGHATRAIRSPGLPKASPRVSQASPGYPGSPTFPKASVDWASPTPHPYPRASPGRSNVHQGLPGLRASPSFPWLPPGAPSKPFRSSPSNDHAEVDH